MTNRRLIVTLAAVLTVAVIGGCGGSSSPTTSATSTSASAHKGGTMTLLVNGNPDSIDTAIAYTFPIQQLLIDTNDGLVGFRRTGGAAGNDLVPDLATTLPTPADGGRTYVFSLRRGIKFSTGQVLTPDDVKYSFVRIFKAGAPTDGTFYSGIVGATQCLASASRCTLAGGVVPDDKNWTVTFHLTAPDPEFLDKLAITFAFILPVGTPNHDIGTHPLPATGPYMIQSYVPNQQVVLVRNPAFHQWSAAAQPAGNPDRIILRIGQTTENEITQVEQAQADWSADTPPPDRLTEIVSKYPSQLHLEPLQATSYLALNTRVPPFNSLAARQAVNYAVNRAAVVKLNGGPGLGTPTCQILPPGIPGYVPYCPYTIDPSPSGRWIGPNPAKARALIAQSHTAGTTVTLYTQNDSVSKSIGLYLVGMLSQLGYHASLKTLTTSAFVGVVGNSSFHTQASLYTWYQDYPRPSDFINVALSCSAFIPKSSANANLAEFCDPKIDAGTHHALTVEETDPAAATSLWSAQDRAVTDQAPWAPLFNPKLADFVSTRVGGYQFNPVWYFLIDQAWVH